MVVLSALWTGWTFYSRHQAAVDVERQAQQKEVDADRKTVAAYGGNQLKILGLNATPPEVSAGGRVLLCYGVSNAVKVKIEPGVEAIKPALSRCLEVFPKQTTKYTLTAEDAVGNSKSGSITIRVR